jgi:hypothetical protein
MIVAAENEADARIIHPSKFITHVTDKKWMGTYVNIKDPEFEGKEYETENDKYSSWVHFSEVDKLRVEKIGVADKEVEKGVILASFNAG